MVIEIKHINVIVDSCHDANFAITGGTGSCRYEYGDVKYQQ